MQALSGGDAAAATTDVPVEVRLEGEPLRRWFAARGRAEIIV